ncbi:MAG: universal stress protein, partial [Cellulomonadaceae bacterium]|nr:universal stress protein [Cellulomonadaceae bacterium]
MTRPESVLVGVDGSPTSMYTLDWAAAFAQRLGWSLHIVYCYSPPQWLGESGGGVDPNAAEPSVEANARQILAQAKERVAELGIP